MMIVENELRKIGIEPYILSREEFYEHYAKSYGVLALSPLDDVYYAAVEIILEFQFRQGKQADAKLTALQTNMITATETIAAQNEIIDTSRKLSQELSIELTALRAENAKLRAALNMVNTRIDDGGCVYFTGAELDRIEAALKRGE